MGESEEFLHNYLVRDEIEKPILYHSIGGSWMSVIHSIHCPVKGEQSPTMILGVPRSW